MVSIGNFMTLKAAETASVTGASIASSDFNSKVGSTRFAGDSFTSASPLGAKGSESTPVDAKGTQKRASDVFNQLKEEDVHSALVVAEVASKMPDQ